MNGDDRQGMLRLNLSAEFQNKTCLAPAKWNKKDNEYNQKWAFGFTFYPKTVTPAEWVRHVTAGKAFTMASYQGNTRRKDTFVSSQIVGLDFDGNVSVADCLADDFIANHAYLIYPTPSSTPENPKTRVMFLLDTPITDVKVWERLQRGLLWQYQSLNPDPSCKDGARLFYGSDKPGYVVLGHTLSVAALTLIADTMETEIGAYETERTAEEDNRIREQNRRNITDDKKRTRYYNYALKALDNMDLTLSGMGVDSGRNSTLFKFGAKCGNLIAAGMIAYSECERALHGAAVRSGLPGKEIDATLPRAINHGMSSPTDTDALDREWERKAQEWRKQQQSKTIDIQEVYARQKAEVPQFANPEIDRQRLETIAKNWLVIHQYGAATSWWSKRDVPLSHLSALMNLTHTRSSAAWVLIAMHQSMIDGALSWALFSVADVVKATGLNRALVKKAFVDLERGGYVRFLKTDSLYNILSIIHRELPLETVHDLSQHPADYFIPSLDTVDIQSRLLKMLRMYYTETLSRRGLATPSREMAAQMGITDVEDYDAWVARFEAARLEDELTDEAARKLKQEFDGDGHNWNGWAAALRSPFAIAVDWKTCESIKDVRGQLLRHWVTVRSVNSQDELCRILGCSTATLSSIMRSQNIATIEQTEKPRYEADFENLETKMRQIQRDKRGMIRMIWFKERNEKGWLSVDVPKAALLYARNRDHITEVSMQIITPSLQKVMTPEEIEAVYLIRERIDELAPLVDNTEIPVEDLSLIKDLLKRAKKAARAAKTKLIPKLIDEMDVLLEQYGGTDTEAVSDPVTPVAKQDTEALATDERTSIASHDWRQFSAPFLHRELSKQVFMFSGYELIGDCVMDSDKNLIFKSDYSLAKLMTWLRLNTTAKVQRNSYEYHGIEVEDYKDELRTELKNRYEKQRKVFYDSLVPEFDIPEDKVIQMALQEKPEPKPQPISDERLQSFLDFCNNRQEREHGIKRPMTDWKMPPKSPVDESWTDASGLLYEICGDDLYVDGVKQYMTPELWNFISRKQKSA